MFSFFNWCLGSFNELTEYIEYLRYKEQKQHLYSLSKSDISSCDISCDISSDINEPIESEIDNKNNQQPDIDLRDYVSIQNKDGTLTLGTSVF
jgi:hypothetical protein